MRGQLPVQESDHFTEVVPEGGRSGMVWTSPRAARATPVAGWWLGMGQAWFPTLIGTTKQAAGTARQQAPLWEDLTSTSNRNGKVRFIC